MKNAQVLRCSTHITLQAINLSSSLVNVFVDKLLRNFRYKTLDASIPREIKGIPLTDSLDELISGVMKSEVFQQES